VTVRLVGKTNCRSENAKQSLGGGSSLIKTMLVRDKDQLEDM